MGNGTARLRIYRDKGGEPLRVKHPGLLIIQTDADGDARPPCPDDQSFVIDDVAGVDRLVEIKLMGILIQQSLRVAVLTVSMKEFSIIHSMPCPAYRFPW